MMRTLIALLALCGCLMGGEPSYVEVAAIASGPMSRQPVISVKAHSEVVWVRPDMAIQMVANPFSFATGETPRQIPWERVERSLEQGYLPIVESRWREGDILYRQTAFTNLLDGGEVRTGHEKQVVFVRMSVTNVGLRGRQKPVLWAFVPGIARAKGDLLPKLDHYGLFDVVGALPEVPASLLDEPDNVLRNGAVVLGVFEADAGVQATCYRRATRLDMDLGPGQTLSVCWKISSHRNGFSAAELARLRRLDYRTAHDHRVRELEAVLARGTRIEVPEAVVNNVYRAQILYNQTAMVQAADRDFYVPVQGYVGVWAWEAAQMLVGLEALGYHEDTAKSYGYFFQTQGRYKPDGDVKSSRGVFINTGTFDDSGWEDRGDSTLYGVFRSRNFPRWANTTGSVLWGLGEHYFYSKDREWLKRVAPQVVEAADWIVRERQATKVRDSQGAKVPHFGLMPAGKPYDVYDNIDKLPSYSYGFTDGWSWLGLQRAAEALSDIGHPDGRRLLAEAASYRADILEVMRRKRQTDPALPPYPERVYGADGWGSFVAGGLTLVQTGLVSPQDPAFEQLERYSRRHFTWLGLNGLITAPEAQMHGIRTIYTVTADDVYHQAWMLRGEVEKALLTFYSVLAYGVDRETLGSVERFSPDDRRFSPFFMNGSASSRILLMIRKTLALEDGGTLRLLAGAPRRWLESGKRIEVRGAVTYFGKLDLRIDSEADAGRIRAALRLERTRPERLERILFRLPHPRRLPIRSVVVNGQSWREFHPGQETIELPAEGDRWELVVSY